MSARPGSLLIVNDEEMNRDMLSRRLELKGYAVQVAGDGRQALTLIDRQAFDAILLDIMMPELNGLDVLRLLRRRYSLADLAVIMVTARDDSEDLVAAFKLGANDYVTKPIDLSVLLARIAAQVAQKRRRGNCARARRGTRWRRAGRTTGCGTGTSTPTRSTTRPDGRRCSAMRTTRSARAPRNGSSGSTSRTLRGSGRS